MASDSDLSQSGVESQEIPQRPTMIRWLVFMLACGTSWFLYLHRYTWNFIAPKLQEDYGWSLNETQGLYSLFMWTYGFGQVPSGIVCDLFGPHVFLGAIIIIWSIVTPLQAVPSQTGLGAVRLLFGAAQAGCYPILAKITYSWFPAGNRTFVQGAVATFFGRGGGAISPIIMATVLMAWMGLSWQAALVVLSVAGVTFGIAFLLLFRNSPDVDSRVNDAERMLIQGAVKMPAVPSGTRQKMPWGRVLSSKSMWFFIFLQMLMAGVDSIYSSLLGVYFLSKGVSLGGAGILASLPLIGGMVGGMIAAVGNDFLIRKMNSKRWGRSLVGIFSNSMACAAMLVMIQQEQAFAAGIGLFAVKFFADMSQPTQWGACTDLGGRAFSATVFGIINTAGNVGGIIFPLVFGWILMSSKTIGVIKGVDQKDFIPLFLFAAGMYITVAVCWYFVDCSKSLDESDA